MLSALFNQRQPSFLQLYYPTHLKSHLLIAPQHLLDMWLWGLKVGRETWPAVQMLFPSWDKKYG